MLDLCYCDECGRYVLYRSEEWNEDAKRCEACVTNKTEPSVDID